MIIALLFLAVALDALDIYAARTYEGEARDWRMLPLMLLTGAEVAVLLILTFFVPLLPLSLYAVVRAPGIFSYVRNVW